MADKEKDTLAEAEVKEVKEEKQETSKKDQVENRT